MTVRVESKADVEKLLGGIDTVLFDCDGVLWAGNTLFPGTKETLQMLLDMGKRLLFVSNNSAKTPQDYLDKIPVKVERDCIVTSAIATALYLRYVRELAPGTSVFIVGGGGIQQALEEQGYKVVREAGHTVGAVVVGLDLNFAYNNAVVAMEYLATGCLFVATNCDSTFPREGQKYPGAGSIVSMVSTAAGREPDAVCGKPNGAMMEAILRSHNLDTERCLMVGDRLNTDMEFGHAFGTRTLLVETGIDSIGLESHPHVDFSAQSLSSLETFVRV